MNVDLIKIGLKVKYSGAKNIEAITGTIDSYCDKINESIGQEDYIWVTIIDIDSKKHILASNILIAI